MIDFLSRAELSPGNFHKMCAMAGKHSRHETRTWSARKVGWGHFESMEILIFATTSRPRYPGQRLRQLRMDRARKTRIECSFLVERASHEHQGVLKRGRNSRDESFFAFSLLVREKKTSVDERGFRTDAGSRKAVKSDQGMPFSFTKKSC
jgi:hypothetical protein